jgi:DNA-binding NarL/FixJ family response regulator
VIRLLVVEDETLFRVGLQKLLSLHEEFEIIGEAADGEEAVRAAQELRPDAVIMDVHLPRCSGIVALEKLRELGLQTPVILLSTFDEEDSFLKGMRAGASAFLRKDVSFNDLVATIHAALRGERVFRPSITAKAAQRASAMKPAFDVLDLPDPLTKREVEVLRLMAAGMSNKEIATALSAGEATVKSHVSSVLSKMGVRDRTRAVLRGLELGCF